MEFYVFILIAIVLGIFIVSINIAYDKGRYSIQFQESPEYMIQIPLNEEPSDKFWIEEYNEELYYVISYNKIILPAKRKKDFILSDFKKHALLHGRVGFDCLKK